MADIQNFFDEVLPNKLTEKPELVESIGSSYQFDIDGAGSWTVDLSGDAGQVRTGGGDNPGCVVTIKAPDFEKLLDNPSSAMMLFTTGRLKVSNLTMAMSLQKLFS